MCCSNAAASAARVTTAAGATCVEALSNQQEGVGYLYFDVRDDVAFDGDDTVEVSVEFLDEGTAPFWLEYDAARAAQNTLAAYRHAGQVNRRNSLEWKAAVFRLDAARFANRQNNGADFRLGSSGPLRVRRIGVRRA